jgi:hypothetical protein
MIPFILQQSTGKYLLAIFLSIYYFFIEKIVVFLIFRTDLDVSRYGFYKYPLLDQ